LAERNRRARPIQWTCTAHKLLAKVRRQRRLAATGYRRRAQTVATFTQWTGGSES
jgi:hypothetical protein